MRSNTFKYSALFCLLFLQIAMLGAEEWEFEQEIFSPRLFLHPFATYLYDVKQVTDWELHQYADTQFRMNIGSVSLNRLNTDVQAQMNHDLNDYFTFRGRYDRQSFQHWPEDKEIMSMEMEARVFPWFSVFVGANPEYDKEDVDAVAGFMIADSTRTRYFRTTLVYEDFVYDEKNEAKGETKREPFGVRWAMHPWNGDVRFYSEGYWTNGYRRTFSAGDSLDTTQLEHYERYALIRITRNSKGGSLYSFDMRFDEYYDHDTRLDTDYSVRRSIYLYQCGFHWDLTLTEKTRLKPGFRYVLLKYRERCPENGFFNTDILYRVEMLYQLIGVWKTPLGTWEGGCLGSQRRIHEAKKFFFGSDPKWEQKLFLGWSWEFVNNAFLKLSVSHEPSIDGFGGANMQLQWRI